MSVRPRRIVLLRHGLTSWNAERRFQGQTDIELTETGHLQAKAAARALAAYEPAVLWSSDLSRTLQTAEYVAEETQLVPVLDERLREIHVGRLQGLTHDEVTQRHGEGPWVYAEHGGESEAKVAARMLACIEEIVDALEEGDMAVVVSHGAAIRLGVAAHLGWSAETLAALGPLDNCGWVELAEGRSGVLASSPWRVAAYNRVAPIS